MSIESEANDAFKANFQEWLATAAPDAVQKEGRVTCSPMVLSYNGVYLWKAAVEKAGTFEPSAVIKALEEGISFDGPGGTVTSQANHHVTKTVYIGETLENGQFEILETIPDVYGEPWLKGTFK